MLLLFPIATAPNAIVFASGRIKMGEMAKAGFLINGLGIFLITAITWWVLIPAFAGMTLWGKLLPSPF